MLSKNMLTDTGAAFSAQTAEADRIKRSKRCGIGKKPFVFPYLQDSNS